MNDLNQPPPPVAPGAGPKPQTSGLAIASLALGICSFVLCMGPLAGIPAVIMGHKANSDIRKSGGMLGGSGLATAGLVTGYLSVLMIFVVGLLAAVAIPNFVKARNQAQFQACQKQIRVIQDAKQSWAKKNGKSDDTIPLESELYGEENEMRYQPGCPAGGTYILNSVKEDPSCTVHGTIQR